MKIQHLIPAALAWLALVNAPAAAQVVKVDPKIPEYKAIEGVSGGLKSIGSDTLNNLMTFWAEGFRGVYPNVKIEIEGKGSSTAPPALIEGTAHFGPMSRPMKSGEIDDFEKKYGYKPTGVPVAVDALGVFVHKDNPLQSLTMQQVDAIFSKTRKGGFDKDIVKWGDLGLTGEWADKPISLYGRNSASGTYGYFKEHALAKGDFKDTVKEQPGSSSVVQGVASDKYAIGYSGIGYVTADVRALAIAADAKSTPIAADAAHAYSGEYPLARMLYVYVNVKPGTPLEPLRREFLRFVLSRQGQELVVKDGYYPVTARIAENALKSIGLEVKLLEAGASK
ncbi:MAG: PstS family phosphate ABC transporter substrate-binding protein [Planctomycetes bacterium]|nr:PstS family phosphate ABC transporter substrate-binding protein [Planctomycetota bacterium]